VAPSFLLACVLWSDVRQAWDRWREQAPPFPALQQAIDEVFESRIGDVSGRGKLAADMREIWMMQPRFEKRSGSAPFTLIEQARFRAGFDFMRLRADVGEVDEALADWWQTFSLADDLGREDLLAQLRTATTRPQRVPRAPRAGPVNLDSGDAPSEPQGVDDPDAPKKRRRRRRRRVDGDAPPSVAD
jgi:poly(A) polymerase